MEIPTRNRSDLKSYFVKNAIPTESNFAELIDGMLNQSDDGVVKLPGTPLSIEAVGDNSSPKNTINIYHTFGDENPAWTLNLNPRFDPNDAASAKLGFNVRDGEGNNRLFIDRNNGNIGVGTIAPAAKLHVGDGDIRLDSGREISFADNGQIRSLDDNHRILFRRSENKLEIREYGDIVLSPGATSGAETARMVVQSNGNVGIGTATPAAKLSFNNVNDGSDGLDGITWYNPSPTAYGIHRTGGAWTAPDYQQLRLGWSTGIILDGGTRYGKSYVDVQGNGLRITSGNVGVGTTAPVEPLDVAGRIRSGALTIGPWPASGNYVFFGTNTLDQAQAGNYALLQQSSAGSGRGRTFLNSSVDIRFRIGNGEGMILANNRNVGIGTTGPTSKLHVNGNINYTNLAKLDVANEFTANVRCADFRIGHSSRRNGLGRALVDSTNVLIVNWGGDWSSGVQYGVSIGRQSTRALKEDIGDISTSQALETLEGLNPVTYTLKSDENRTTQAGFVVEDVPDLISSPDGKAVVNDHIVAVLTRVVKEQQKAIEALTEKLGT